MAARPTHNEIAKLVLKNMPMKEIDDVNRKVDDIDMLRKYGKYHRNHWGHNPDSHAPDSRVINKGNYYREKARKIHILVDTDPKIKRLVKKHEMLKRLR